MQTTRRLYVDTADPDSVATGIEWWQELTDAGCEGVLVKPSVKVRCREYLRLIYGRDYTEPQNLTRLRERGLGHKRSLAGREYALGLESLERATAGELLWRVHEPVFAVLALESEPVDPCL